MAHLEIQIANDPLMESLRILTMERVYANCYVIDVPDLILDNLAVGTAGPGIPTNGSVVVPVRIGISLVTPEDVILANGGPSFPAGVPQISGNFLLTVSGTTLTVTYVGIDHNADYDSLLRIVTIKIGKVNAQSLFDKTEANFLTTLGSSPLLQYDFGLQFPPQLNSLQIGRSNIASDPSRIAIRFEIGAVGADGDWTSFLKGDLDDHLQGNDWGLFISSDTVVQIANSAVTEAVASAGGTVIGSNWAPVGGVAAVDTSVLITFHGHVEVWPGITLFDGDVTVLVDLHTIFDQDVGGLRSDISYNIKVQGDLTADIINDLGLANMFAAGNSIKIPAGYTKIGDREFYRVTSIPTQILENELTLRPGVVLGLPDGMLIGGSASVTPGLAPPDCNVASTPFLLQYLVSCSALLDHTQGPPTAVNVTASCSFSAWESYNSQFPLIIGAFRLVNSIPADFPPGSPPDPEQQYSPYLPVAPQQIGAGTSYEIQVPIPKISSGYKNDPYPCQLLLLTNGGARYLSLGQIPVPKIVDGEVANASRIYIPDCNLGEIDPWAVMVAVFNPIWLVDPGPAQEVELVEAVARSLVGIITRTENGRSAPIVIGETQVGALALGTLIAGRASEDVGSMSAAKLSSALVTRLFQDAARLQPPNIRGQVGAE
jgi:hypothetical protein